MGRRLGECGTGGGHGRSQAEGHSGIEYGLTILEEIRREAVDGLRAVPRGGLEVGGVLFGTEQEGSVRITAHRALACEHALGPGFVLSGKDEAGLRALLAAPPDPEAPGLRPVGWYRSRTRADISLTDRDLELHARYFPEPWQLVAVLRPEHSGVARAAFFVRTPDGKVSAGREFTIAPPARRPAPELAGGREPAIRAIAAIRPEPEVPRFLRVAADRAAMRKRSPSLSWRWLALVLALVFVTVAIAGRSYERRRESPGAEAPPAPIQLRAVDSNGQLLITWDKNAKPILESEKAELQIVDGLDRTALDLDREGVTKGSVTYVRRSGRVDLSLKVHGAGAHVEEVVCFLGEPVAREDAAVRERDEALAEAGKLRSALRDQIARANELEMTVGYLRRRVAAESALRAGGGERLRGE